MFLCCCGLNAVRESARDKGNGLKTCMGFGLGLVAANESIRGIPFHDKHRKLRREASNVV